MELPEFMHLFLLLVFLGPLQQTTVPVPGQPSHLLLAPMVPLLGQPSQVLRCSCGSHTQIRSSNMSGLTF